MQDAALFYFALWLYFIFVSVLLQSISCELQVLALIFTFKLLLVQHNAFGMQCTHLTPSNSAAHLYMSFVRSLPLNMFSAFCILRFIYCMN